MLTFKKGGYNKEELLVLYDALTDARALFQCSNDGCDHCKNRRPCADLTRVCEYVFRLYSADEKT